MQLCRDAKLQVSVIPYFMAGSTADHVSATMAVFWVAKADRGVYSLVIRP